MSQVKYLDLTNEYARSKGAMHTAREIAGQPKLWNEVFSLVLEKKQGLQEFLEPVFKIDGLRVILTGAGSSAFIGSTIQGIFQSETQKITQAIATTDLVTHPAQFFLRKIPTLLISFARSGNSPESIETINLANVHCDEIFHLIITCNENGYIIQNNHHHNSYIFLLPKIANDKGLAMTGSFTSMLLSIMLIAKLPQIKSLESAFEGMVRNARLLLGNYFTGIKDAVKNKYERIIFLGSGPMLGIARECQLKVQELSDGKVICKYDSFLGFRHGPRVVTNEKSLLVYLFSNDEHVFQYEKDLAMAIESESPGVPVVCFGRKLSCLENSILEIGCNDSTGTADDFYFIPATLIGQLFGFYNSLELGLEPDNPSVSGTINREVQGVTIYSVSNVL